MTAQRGDVLRFRIHVDGELLSGLDHLPISCKARVLLLHGAGTSHQAKYDPLVSELRNQGLAVRTFDFSGHGHSSGTLPQSSLQRRLREAEAVLAATDSDLPMVLLAFSMSGQTACDMLPRSPNVRALILVCPAVYSKEVYDLPFGQSEFTSRIRVDGSWRTSTAFQAVATFPGRLLLVTPRLDEIVPPQVAEQIMSVRDPGRTEHLVIKSRTHQVASWLARHSDIRKALAEKIATLAVRD